MQCIINKPLPKNKGEELLHLYLFHLAIKPFQLVIVLQEHSVQEEFVAEP
jgi:hypothetical protein